MLEIQGLTKSYLQADQRQHLFDRIALDVQNAEVVALLGASGSGKTTLLNLVSGIDDPDSGVIAINGTDIHQLGEPQRTLFRRNQIGFIFQFFNLIPTLTVGENIALPLELTNAGPSATADRVADLLHRVELGKMADRYPETLSGGEQQRIAVARALAHRPKLLLADEPTGNLDEATGESVIALLGELARDQQASLLVVTHSDRVTRVADRVLRLDRGQLLAA